MTETGKMEILRFILKAIVTLAGQSKPITPKDVDIINEGNRLLEEIEKWKRLRLQYVGLTVSKGISFLFVDEVWR